MTMDQTKTGAPVEAERSPDEMRTAIARLEKKIKKLEGDVNHLRFCVAELAKECAATQAERSS